MSSRDQNKFDGKPLRANFNARAQLQPEDHRRILISTITSEEGRRDLERLTRAGDRYEQRRIKAEIIAPRERLLKEAREAALKCTLPPPNYAPPGWGGQRGGASATEVRLHRYRQMIETREAAKDFHNGHRIYRQRCALENVRLEQLAAKEPERLAAERAKQKDSASKDIGRETLSQEFQKAARGRSETARAFQRTARDTGRDD
jgi:hypothetical protein